MKKIYLYTDGACSGNPGPGGYGIVLKAAGMEKTLSKGFRLTTNGRMEVMAVAEALKAIKWTDAEVILTSDAEYVVKAFSEGRLLNWEARGWSKVANTDLWKEILKAMRAKRLTVSANWVKGHAGHPENERCDRLAVEAYKGKDLTEDKGYKQEKKPLKIGRPF